MKIFTLHCSTCDKQITDAAWRSIFGSSDGVAFYHGCEPTYQCGCDGEGGRVYFSASFIKEQLEAAKDDAGTFFRFER